MSGFNFESEYCVKYFDNETGNKGLGQNYTVGDRFHDSVIM